MAKKSFPLPKVYRLLEPGPVVGCVISNRNYSFGILRATRECVINIPTVELAKKVVRCGNTTGRKIDKGKFDRPLNDTCGSVHALPVPAPPHCSDR